ncbi:MAG TPA: peptide deformylase [Verrucomicrobiota bacterium]|nr:peptide deformylase [Verrucomicrobiales bacterium]HRI14416.1 peptide deformylase [Verrucomicrobiota bacterium]
MVLPVIKFGDPVLRRRGARIESVTPEVQQLIVDMFETMRAAKGVGLAAQQVGQELQLTVVDVRGVKDRPSQLWLAGQPADVEAFMPLVLINPKVVPAGEAVKGPEGCLSFPEVFADITRPAEVEVTAQNERGETFSFRAGGLLARAVQHEVDHLNGVLFIDRMDTATRQELKQELEELQATTKSQLSSKPPRSRR